MIDQGSTHWEGCWEGGRHHYDCALAEIERLRSQVAVLQAWKDAVPVEAIHSIFDSGGVISCSASDGFIPPAGTMFQVHWKDGKNIFSVSDAMCVFSKWVAQLKAQP